MNNNNSYNKYNGHNNHNVSFQKGQIKLSDYEPLNDTNYVDCAEKAIESLKQYKDKKGNYQVISTNQIRKILSLNSEIYNNVINSVEQCKLTEEIIGRINYLKVRILYDCGREKTVKDFVEQTHLKKHIEEVVTKKENQKKYYLLFSQYLEALVAFRYYVFGEDKNK
jgi:CRISPR-associated protein Csm2